jgi:hypothetical protein
LEDYGSQSSLAMFMKENDVVFADKFIIAQLSADPFDVPITVVLHEISSANEDCFLIPDLDPQATTSPESTPIHTLHYGCNVGVDKLKKILLDYINAVSNHRVSREDMITGDTSMMIWRILGSICRFHCVNLTARNASTYLAC